MSGEQLSLNRGVPAPPHRRRIGLLVLTLLVLTLLVVLVGALWAEAAALSESSEVQPSLVEWAGLSALGVLIGLTIANGRKGDRLAEMVRSELLAIDTALRGYKDTGGLIQNIEELRREAATVDDRIKESRHQVRNDLQEDILKLETNVMQRLEQFERRIDQRLSDLGLRGRTQGG